MRNLTLGAKTIAAEPSDAVPDGSVPASCSCGGTQFRADQSPDGKIYLTCPTCGGMYNTAA